jgi:hypothetical protein
MLESQVFNRICLSFVNIIYSKCQYCLNHYVKSQLLLEHTAEMLGSKDNVDDQFMEMIDDLVVMSEKDSELAEGLKWIDLQSQRNGLTFYEMAMIILRKHMVERRAKEWLREKISQ